jgi:hypothetical protein
MLLSAYLIASCVDSQEVGGLKNWGKFKILRTLKKTKSEKRLEKTQDKVTKNRFKKPDRKKFWLDLYLVLCYHLLLL